jgi:hypothetical protein
LNSSSSNVMGAMTTGSKVFPSIGDHIFTPSMCDAYSLSREAVAGCLPEVASVVSVQA